MNTSPPSLHPRFAYGLDENAGSPILVKASGHGKRITFVPATRSDLASPPAGTAIAACLLQKESFTRRLTVPIASSRKAETVFQSVLDIQLPFPVEECETALLTMRPTPDKTGTEGLVVGARKTDIERRLESLSSLGVNPHILDQEGIALWSRALVECPPTDRAALRIVIYLGPDRVTLALGQGADFVVAQSLRQADPDTVYRLLKSLFPHAPASTEWLFTGPGARDADGVQALHNAFASRWPGLMTISPEPDTFLARALAARALGTGPLRCNLRTGGFLHPEWARALARQPYRLATAVLAAGLLLCSVNLTWHVTTRRHLNQGQQAIRSLAMQVTGTSRGLPKGQETLSAKRFMEARTLDLEPFLAATDAPVTQILRDLLTAARDEGVTIETLTLNLKNGVIHGRAPKFSQGEAMARKLNGHGWTATIEHKEPAPGDTRVAFVIGLGGTRETK